MMKYSVIVIAGGTIVCIQIRTTRRDSLRTIVVSPIEVDPEQIRRGQSRRRAARRCVVRSSRYSPLSLSSTSRMNSSSSRLVFVRMLDDVQRLRRQCREHVVQALALRDVDLDLVLVAQPHRVAVERRRAR